MAQVVDTELISEDELRSSAGAASRFERRTTVSFNFFRFSPVLENSLLADAPTPPAPLCRLHFRPFLTWAPLVFARRQWWYNYVLPCIILWFMITLMFFDFQTTQWYNFAYGFPLALIVLCELTTADRDLLVALVKSFESWLVWISLMGMFVLGWIGKASNKYNGNAKLASEKVSLYVMAYSVTVIGGIALIWLESIQRTELGSRVRTFCIFLLLVVLGRVMILDRFFYPMFDTLEICMLFCSDTRQLAIAFCQTWAIFTLKQMIKFQFGGGATSILVLDLEYKVKRSAATAAVADAVTTVDAQDAPIIIHVTMTGAPLREHVSLTGGNSISAPHALSREHCRRKSVLDSGDATTAMVDDEFVISDADDIQLDNLTSVGDPPAPASQSTMPEESHVDVDAAATDSAHENEENPDQSVPPADVNALESILCASSIVYRPLLCIRTSTIERVTSSLAYRTARALFVALLIASFVLHAFAPSVVWPFTLLLCTQHVFIIGDLGRVDRSLLSFVVRRFDFWFLFVYQIMFLALQLHGPLTNAQCGVETGWTTNPMRTVAIAYITFWINMGTFLTDAMPLASRGFKTNVLLLTLANAIRILVFDRMPSRFEPPFCLDYGIYVSSLRIGDVRSVCLGFLLTFSIFQCRYLWRIIFTPKHFVLLSMPVRINSEA